MARRARIITIVNGNQHPRRICDLFGLFVEAGLRCTSAVDQPSIVEYRLRNSGPRPSPRADDIG